MMLKQCCIRWCSSCENCELYALLMHNPLSKSDILYYDDCLIAVMNYAEYLRRELSVAPSGKRDADAVKLIELVGSKLEHYNYSLTLCLCEVTADSLISRGLKSSIDKRRAYTLMGHYCNFLNDFEHYETDESSYFDAHAAYLNSRFRIQHLVKDFVSVVKEYQIKKTQFSFESPIQRELAAHFSASAYLTNIKAYKITSRDVAEQLYETVQKRYITEGKLSSGDYYILAKFLEHHIQENNIYKGLDTLSPFMDAILADKIESSREAINKAVFHRDMFEALGKVDSDECIFHFDAAQQIIDDYGITDQRTKLRQKKEEVDLLKSKAYQNIPPKSQMIVVDQGATAVINPIIHGSLEIHERSYTVADAEHILSLILESQEERFEKLIDGLVDELSNSYGEIKKLGEILKETKSNSNTKGVFSRLREFINNTTTTTENLSKLYALFAKMLPAALQKMPEIEKMICSFLGNN